MTKGPLQFPSPSSRNLAADTVVALPDNVAFDSNEVQIFISNFLNHYYCYYFYDSDDAYYCWY